MQGLQNRQRNNANLLRVADLEGLEFNTPVPFFDTAVPCGVPGDLGDVPKIFIMMPNELVGPYDTYCTRATGDSMADLKIMTGDILVLENVPEYHSHDIVLAEIDGEKTLKTYYVDEDGTLEIQYIGPGKYRYGDMKNIRKHLVVEVPRGTELKDIDIDGVDNRVRIEQVLSREVTVDGVKVNVNAHYPDTMPDEIGIDGVNCLLALYVQPSAGLTVEMSGLTPELRCDLPSRKEGEKTIVGDGGCKVDADGVNVKLIVSEWK